MWAMPSRRLGLRPNKRKKRTKSGHSPSSDIPRCEQVAALLLQLLWFPHHEGLYPQAIGGTNPFIYSYEAVSCQVLSYRNREVAKTIRDKSLYRGVLLVPVWIQIMLYSHSTSATFFPYPPPTSLNWITVCKA